MHGMSLSEADTRAKLIDPALHKRGWTEDLIRREETDRGIEIVEGKPRRKKYGRIDYLLRIRVNVNTQPIAVALIEAKRSSDPPDKGLEQAKRYACLNHVPFVYSSNCLLQLKLPSDSIGKYPLIPVQSIHPPLWKGSSFAWILEHVGTLVEWVDTLVQWASHLALAYHRGYVSFDFNIMGVGMANRRLSTRKIKIGFKNSSWWLDMVGALQQFGETFDFPFIRCWAKCRLIHFI